MNKTTQQKYRVIFREGAFPDCGGDRRDESRRRRKCRALDHILADLEPAGSRPDEAPRAPPRKARKISERVL